MDSPAVTTLDKILKSYLNLKGISSAAQYKRYMQILIEGFTTLNISHTKYHKTYVARANEVNQIALPSDFIDWISIAVNISGKKWELDTNDNLLMEPFNEATVPVFDTYNDGPDMSGAGYVAKRSNGIGEFILDSTSRIIRLKGDYTGKNIYIKYISSGVPNHGEVYVPIGLKESLQYYIEWKLKDFNDNASENSKMIAETRFGNALIRYYDTQDNMSYKEFLDVFRNGMHQGIKR